MLEHMAYIVYVENRTFSFKDFCRFEVIGKEFKMSHGTFRNKISKLSKKGIVKLAYVSHIGFYTLQVNRFDTSVITHNHTGGTISYNSNSMRMSQQNNSSNTSTTNHNHKSGNGYLYDLIMGLPLEHNSIHDIRLNFKVKGIWSVLYNYHHNDKYFSIELTINQ